jgi:hypothetical protein
MQDFEAALQICLCPSSLFYCLSRCHEDHTRVVPGMKGGREYKHNSAVHAGAAKGSTFIKLQLIVQICQWITLCRNTQTGNACHLWMLLSPYSKVHYMATHNQ